MYGTFGFVELKYAVSSSYQISQLMSNYVHTGVIFLVHLAFGKALFLTHQITMYGSSLKVKDKIWFDLSCEAGPKKLQGFL